MKKYELAAELGALRAALFQATVRAEATSGYGLNSAMMVETRVLYKEIDAMKERIGQLEEEPGKECGV